MDYSNIRVEKRDLIAVVTLDRPKVLNALNAETLLELGAAFESLGSDSTIRAVLLAGAGGRAFAAGADIRELAAIPVEEGRAFALRGQAVMRKIETLGKPVIACIQGFALGGGCELALACTLRIAADDARLGQPEVKLGVITGYGGSQRLARLVGRGAARAEALVWEIAANGPLAVVETLHAVDEGLDLPLDLSLMREAERFGHLCATADKTEGTRAFLEKRAPVWKGE